jgi:hypothetical protein
VRAFASFELTSPRPVTLLKQICALDPVANAGGDGNDPPGYTRCERLMSRHNSSIFIGFRLALSAATPMASRTASTTAAGTSGDTRLNKRARDEKTAPDGTAQVSE